MHTVATWSRWTVRCGPPESTYPCICDEAGTCYRIVDAGGALELVDTDHRTVAVVRASEPDTATIVRPGHPLGVVRRSYPDSSVNRWSVFAADVGTMTLYGDVAVAQAILPRGPTVAAEVRSLGMQEYEVSICDSVVDRVLALCVVIAATFLED